MKLKHKLQSKLKLFRANVAYFKAWVYFRLFVKPHLMLVNEKKIFIDPRAIFRAPAITCLDASEGEVYIGPTANIGASTLLGPIFIKGNVATGFYQHHKNDLVLHEGLKLCRQATNGFITMVHEADEKAIIFLSPDEGYFYMPDNGDALVEYLMIRSAQDEFLSEVNSLELYPETKAKLLASKR